ncbi:hypothetical protein E2562_011099 [Oryza meyeriana var. granulata]|uniref:Uncharacterized protein n=1 Tax=Oryza meyeriana var. granulata TaxID=110450 RepID=A0A6G1EWM5_9ORYZ|nr:hypothetical protein E2562_011099 [Oryza meyeriana var. granulata]
MPPRAHAAAPGRAAARPVEAASPCHGDVRGKKEKKVEKGMKIGTEGSRDSAEPADRRRRRTAPAASAPQRPAAASPGSQRAATGLRRRGSCPRAGATAPGRARAVRPRPRRSCAVPRACGGLGRKKGEN